MTPTDVRASITWDRWAVPTVTAPDEAGVVWGIGHSQAVAHAREVLELYAKARGTAAALWGPGFVDHDEWQATLGLARHVDEWWAALEPATVARLEAFADGFNAACAEDPARGGDRRDALPVSARDVVAHVLRVFVGFAAMDLRGLAFPVEYFASAGSNAWAIAGSRSSTGGALLCTNPHLAWKGYHRFFQVRTASPGRTFDGIALIGFPWQIMGHSPAVGWAHTVNKIPLLTVFELALEDGGYRFGDAVEAFEASEVTIEVAGEAARTVTARRTVHGPVLTAPDGTEVAVRIAGVLHHPATATLEGWWQMSLASSVADIFARVDERPIAMFNAVAADGSGSIGALSCGTPAVLERYADCERRLPGDDPRWLWHDVRPQASMPRVVDPACGWVQSTNDPPWFYADDGPQPSTYGASVAPVEPDDLRSIQTRTWLRAQEVVSPEALLAHKFSTASLLGEIVVPELCAAADADATLADAAAVLRAWDRRADAGSSGWPLFFYWFAMLEAMRGVAPILAPPDVPGDLPPGLADVDLAVAALGAAVATLGALGVPLDVSQGAIATMTDGIETVPCDGGVAMLKILAISPGEDGFTGAFGDTYVSLVQLHPDGAAVVDDLLVYGNTTEPTAPARDAEVALFAASRLRPR